MKTRVVKSRVLADLLVWIGFEYTKDEEGNFIFERTSKFDSAWRDIHYLRSKFYKVD